jgi:succinate dehydrogenase / fumarate reductase cytochrome b subunit
MAANDTRPVNLDLTKFSFPVMAIASILHRITAGIVWVGLGIALYALCTATESAEGFANIQQALSSNFLAQFVTWGLLSSFGYYCVATLKHIIQELGFFEDLNGGRAISWLVIVLGVIATIAAGVYVWA